MEFYVVFCHVNQRSSWRPAGPGSAPLGPPPSPRWRHRAGRPRVGPRYPHAGQLALARAQRLRLVLLSLQCGSKHAPLQVFTFPAGAPHAPERWAPIARGQPARDGAIEFPLLAPSVLGWEHVPHALSDPGMAFHLPPPPCAAGAPRQGREHFRCFCGVTARPAGRCCGLCEPG